MFESFHNKLSFELLEKLRLTLGRDILVIPPKLDFVALDGWLLFKENENALITMDYNNLTVLNTEMIGDSTVVGIAILNNSIYLSYRDRRIEKFKDL